MASDKKLSLSKRKEIDTFIAKANMLQTQKRQPKARLLFAMDATASRQPTWDQASHIQISMFNATTDHPGTSSLSIQVAYYRGFDEFAATAWLSDPKQIQKKMAMVSCMGGHTQIKRVLNHALKEHKQEPLKAVVFIGDALEENPDDLCHLAGKMGLFKLPLFIFQEGFDASVSQTFRQMCYLSGGAFAHFDQSSPQLLTELLGAVACYTTGGSESLKKYVENKSDQVKQLTSQIQGNSK